MLLLLLVPLQVPTLPENVDHTANATKIAVSHIMTEIGVATVVVGEVMEEIVEVGMEIAMIED